MRAADLMPRAVLQVFYPMTVTRVAWRHGTTPEPPLDPGWSDLDKLRWHAGLVRHETGLPITVTTGGSQVMRRGEWVEIPGMYGFTIGNSSHGGRPYRAAWDFLNGVETGYREAQRARR